MATIPNVADDELIETVWGNTVANELNTLTIKTTGNQTKTGNLTISGAGNGIALPAGEPSGAARAARKDYVDTQDALRVAKAGDTMSGGLQVGGDPLVPQSGASLTTSGRVDSTQGTPQAGDRNIRLNRIDDAAATGQQFVLFRRTSSLTAIGSISIASASSVGYNTTSDPRLKKSTGRADDAADIVQTLGQQAYRGRWIADEVDGDEWVFLNSTDIEAVAPYAVTGEADAVDDDGEIIPQQVDHGALVPLLTAALSQALDRIAALEAATA